MQLSKERLLWFYRLKNSLNKFSQIHCISPNCNTILQGTRDYDAIKTKFIIKLLPNLVILKLKTATGVQEHQYPDWACNANLANDILFQIIVGGTHIPRLS